jgi:hypothetical protein
MNTATNDNTLAPADALAAKERMYDSYADSAPEYIQAAAKRAAGGDIVEHYRRLLAVACYDEQVAERIAGQYRQGWVARHSPLLVVGLTGIAETALAYFGLTLAVPSMAQAGDSELLSLIAGQGALLTAIAIGVVSTAVTAMVGRQLSMAQRGFVAEPAQPSNGMKETS